MSWLKAGNRGRPGVGQQFAEQLERVAKAQEVPGAARD